MKWAARPLQATLFLPRSPLVWGKRWKRSWGVVVVLGGGGVDAFRELGGPPTERAFITQAFSWVLGLLIKDIISQQNQPCSQHDWECLINTKEKHSAWANSLKTATSITASEMASHCPRTLFFTVWRVYSLWLVQLVEHNFLYGQQIRRRGLSLLEISHGLVYKKEALCRLQDLGGKKTVRHSFTFQVYQESTATQPEIVCYAESALRD